MLFRVNARYTRGQGVPIFRYDVTGLADTTTCIFRFCFNGVACSPRHHCGAAGRIRYRVFFAVQDEVRGSFFNELAVTHGSVCRHPVALGGLLPVHGPARGTMVGIKM